MGGNKVSAKKICFTILLVFLVSGLWHGAKYTFLVWALIHAVFLILEHFLKEKKENATNFFAISIKTLCVFIITTLAWVFFRSQNINEAVTVLTKLFSINSPNWEKIPMNLYELIFSFILIIILLSCEIIIKTLSILNSKKYYPVLWFLIIVCYLFGIFNYKQFIYFQF